ncbi:hypothetical protein SISNIDRAFT_450650 [Sistotremastrum niveocremeum HHB9708]|uniref:Uncharacterized protein n=1 Tax=Sistotremastrum niveocremeum HHB9708 TaxID=1314777 RepID=A0A164YGJ8_9AGAM|nr:hypothetical protein SISNIDRAFT_450650 [Sistotremastrum niveocremeum HHB9708]
MSSQTTLASLTNVSPPAKRKSTGGADGAKAKKPRTSKGKAGESHEFAKNVIQGILDNGSVDKVTVPEDDEDVREWLWRMAQYARSLEQGAGIKPAKSPEEIGAAAEKLTTTVRRGIEKQMNWKPSCKTGSAKFSYDGVCPDPDVFGAMLGLDGKPTWKAKKFEATEFSDLMGGIQASVRYDNLYITSKEVNAKWNPDTGEFKFSGSYGKRVY